METTGSCSPSARPNSTRTSLSRPTISLPSVRRSRLQSPWGPGAAGAAIWGKRLHRVPGQSHAAGVHAGRTPLGRRRFAGRPGVRADPRCERAWRKHRAGRAWTQGQPGTTVVWHELWEGRPDEIAAAIDPEYDHASWSENFPWTRLPGVEIPAERKPPVVWPRTEIRRRGGTPSATARSAASISGRRKTKAGSGRPLSRRSARVSKPGTHRGGAYALGAHTNIGPKSSTRHSGGIRDSEDRHRAGTPLDRDAGTLAIGSPERDHRNEARREMWMPLLAKRSTSAANKLHAAQTVGRRKR